MKIWAHRGCSQMYPENTLLSFAKAIQIDGLAGIELDIQLTKDERIVVIHDEKVDRTTDGHGYVKDFTYDELKRLSIDAGNGKIERIPSIEEVLDLLEEKMNGDFLLNIELKNNNIPYIGMEEKILRKVSDRNLENNVVYSTFYALSLMKIRNLHPNASIGILDIRVSDCLFKRNGGCGADALHPFWKGMDVSKEKLYGQVVRAWFGGHLYPEKSTGKKMDIKELEKMGITDVFLNEPEAYL